MIHPEQDPTIGTVKVAKMPARSRYYMTITPGLTNREYSHLPDEDIRPEVACNLPDLTVFRYEYSEVGGIDLEDMRDSVFVRFGEDVTRYLGNRSFEAVLHILQPPKQITV